MITQEHEESMVLRTGNADTSAAKAAPSAMFVSSTQPDKRKGKRGPGKVQKVFPGKVANVDADDSKNSQNLLIRALWHSMSKRNHTVPGLASVLDVTYGYLLALARGERPMNLVSHDILVRAADYLQIPVAQAYVWAGVLQPSDFYNARSLRFELDSLYEDLMSNTGINMFAPSKDVWDALPDSAKLTIGLLYEQVREKQFITQINTVAGSSGR